VSDRLFYGQDFVVVLWIDCFNKIIVLVELVQLSILAKWLMTDVMGQWIGYKVGYNVQTWLSGVMLDLYSSSSLLILLAS